MSLSYEDMLKEAAARQKANDAENRKLILQKKQSEVEQKKKLIEEHKKLSGRKDIKPAEKKPANLNDLLSTYKIPKKKLEGEESHDTTMRRGHSSHRSESSRNGHSSHSMSQNRQPSKPLSSYTSQRDLSSRTLSSNHSRSSVDIRAPSSSAASKSSTSALLGSSQRSSSQSHSSDPKSKPSTLSQNNERMNGSSLPKNNISLMSTKPQNRPTTHLDNTKALIHPPKSLAVANGSSKNGTSKNSGNDLSDILSGAKHSSKVISSHKPALQSQRPRIMPPPPSSKPMTSKIPENPSSSKMPSKVPQRGPPPSSSGRSGMSLSSKHSAKPLTIKKPAAPPASFEEMMRLAATNLNKGDAPIQQNPPPPKPKLPRDPPPSIKEVKKSQMVASKASSSSQRDIRTSSSLQKDSKKSLPAPSKSNSSNISQKPVSKYPSNNYPNSKPSMMVKNDKPGITDRAKPAVDGRLKNPERFRNSMPAVKRPASMPMDRHNSVQKDRYPSLPSRDRYNPPPYNRQPIPSKRPRYDEEDDYDDEDSMDDFIVDDEAEDVEKELRSVLRGLCRSDETVWQKREREIDLSKMNARFHDIDAEEKRSTRIARLEDMIEEHRGSQAL